MKRGNLRKGVEYAAKTSTYSALTRVRIVNLDAEVRRGYNRTQRGVLVEMLDEGWWGPAGHQRPLLPRWIEKTWTQHVLDMEAAEKVRRERAEREAAEEAEFANAIGRISAAFVSHGLDPLDLDNERFGRVAIDAAELADALERLVTAAYREGAQNARFLSDD